MIVAVVVANMLGGVLANTGADHDNLCRDLTDYGDLTYINETVTVCSSKLEKICEEKTKEKCMEVTEMDCEVELFTDCSMNMKPLEIEQSKPATLTKTLPSCTKEFRKEKHEKTHYECQEVTRQHCTTLWKIINGAKVWAGNEDDCKDVTWEECNPVTVEVEWEVPFMNCTDKEYPYVSYENTTTEVMADTMDCRVEKRVVCTPKSGSKCANITFSTCTEVSSSQ